MRVGETESTSTIRLVWTNRDEDLVPWVQMVSQEWCRSFVSAGQATHAGAVRSRLIDGLAQLAFRIWPRWDGLSHTGWVDDPRPSSPRVFEHILRGTAGISDRWLKRALARMERHRRPRVPDLPAEIEIDQLRRVLGGGHGLAGLWQPPRSAEPGALAAVLASLEGFVARADMPLYVAVSPRLVHSAALQRFGYRAVHLDRQPHPETSGSGCESLGKTHPKSPGEAELRRVIRDDPQLIHRFRFNPTVRLRSGITHRVDLLCEDSRVVIEVDGWQHSKPAQHEADLVRDQQLMADGFVVLRVLHSRALRQTRGVVEEIRQVLDARARQGIGSIHGT